MNYALHLKTCALVLFVAIATLTIVAGGQDMQVQHTPIQHTLPSP